MSLIQMNDVNHPIYNVIVRRILLSDTWWGWCPICKKERFIYISKDDDLPEFWGCVLCPYETVFKSVEGIYPSIHEEVILELEITVRMFPKEIVNDIR
jgi:hypothetical protein